jgi:GxxExxY protein
MLDHRDLTERIIGLAIEVYRKTGPGLLGSIYVACMCFELEQAGIPRRQQVGIPVFYKGMKMPMGFRADILAADTVIVEIKAVPALVPAHEAQLQTYLLMSGIAIGLLLNFHALRLKDGLKRFVASESPLSAALRGPPVPSFKMEDERTTAPAPPVRPTRRTP